MTSEYLAELPGIETTPYQAICRLNCCSFHCGPVQFCSLPAVLFSGLDGVKTDARGRQLHGVFGNRRSISTAMNSSVASRGLFTGRPVSVSRRRSRCRTVLG
jgi:hypothetical protein